jgi:hypothetical protein
MIHYELNADERELDTVGAIAGNRLPRECCDSPPSSPSTKIGSRLAAARRGKSAPPRSPSNSGYSGRPGRASCAVPLEPSCAVSRPGACAVSVTLERRF